MEKEVVKEQKKWEATLIEMRTKGSISDTETGWLAEEEVARRGQRESMRFWRKVMGEKYIKIKLNSKWLLSVFKNTEPELVVI